MRILGRKRGFLIFLIFIIFPIIASFILGEILVRRFSKTGYLTPEILKGLSLQYERGVIARNVFPQKEQWSKGENDADVYINEKGYRGKNFEINKPKGTIRIMFYGGSSVFDIAVSEGKDWPHRVEELLKKKGFVNVEIINAGTPANKTFESLGRLLTEGYIFSPDYIVLSGQWNDFKYFRSEEPILRHLNVYGVKDDPFITYRNWFDRFLSEHSQLYIRLRTRYFRWRYKPTNEGAELPGEFSQKISELAVKQYRLSIETFVDLVRNSGAIPVLMTEPRMVAVDNNKDEKARIQYNAVKLTHEALIEAFRSTDDMIQDVAKEKKVIFIDVARKLGRAENLFKDQIHTTGEGSEKIAEIVADEFAKILRNNQ